MRKEAENQIHDILNREDNNQKVATSSDLKKALMSLKYNRLPERHSAIPTIANCMENELNADDHLKILSYSADLKCSKKHDMECHVDGQSKTGALETPSSEQYTVNFNSGNTRRNSRRAYVQEEVVEGMNAPKETGNVQRTLRTPSSGNTSTVQCYNCSGKGHYARNCPKPRVRDSKYFMEQMLLAKQDEAGVILTDEQNDFLFADASRMEEIEELSANICLMARIQPADHTSDDGPSYESAFISEVQSSSIDENNEPMYPTHTKIINSTIGDDQINSNIKFDSFKGNVNSGSVEKDTHVPDLCAVEKLARNAYQEAEKQRIFAQQVQTQNTHLTSQLEMYKERVRILENINKDNNYLNEFLEADERAKRYNKQAQSQLVRDRDII
ncbi:retrovirus-related pol polyprotein from transposon TNT 1-94 [Tanacetum coccineum]